MCFWSYKSLEHIKPDYWVERQAAVTIITSMAYFQYLSETDNECLLTIFKPLLEDAGLRVCIEFSNKSQIFAEEVIRSETHSAKVNVLISWHNKNLGQFSVEIRSDEPHSKNDTHCQRIASELNKLIPPRERKVI